MRSPSLRAPCRQPTESHLRQRRLPRTGASLNLEGSVRRSAGVCSEGPLGMETGGSRHVSKRLWLFLDMKLDTASPFYDLLLKNQLLLRLFRAA